MTQPTYCPKCNADFDGGPIPEHLRKHYSPPYRWSRLIGVERLEDVTGYLVGVARTADMNGREETCLPRLLKSAFGHASFHTRRLTHHYPDHAHI